MYIAYQITSKRIVVAGYKSKEEDVIALCKETGANCYINKKTREWAYC